MRGGHATSAKELAPLVIRAIRRGDVAMAKGSLGSRMFDVVKALEASAGAAAFHKVENGE